MTALSAKGEAMLEAIEDIVITVLLVFFTVVLALLALDIPLLWLPTAMVGWATVRLWWY